ncbi:MFS transporter [Methylobacterium nonmethylotrophicum]|uniref:MFS transporter n=1 Tax=Methylobacterium nonmethylotrophicum TaxID=1141884 RepID=A0A4Z0NI70_9HYPH|nr:MFS transporter [Methylobacterium nonmethylotrophicum]TGD95984.1 MFS transporter [Methylobacterium nonmethylotrophicum]
MSPQRRWPAISALGIVQILAWGCSYYLLTVLGPSIARETGWPLAWIFGSLSAGMLMAGLVSPLAGRSIGRYGGRPVLVVSTLLLAAGLALLALSPNLPVFGLAWLVIGAGMGSGLYDAAFATLGRLYGADARPAITALTLWGGFSSTLCWPLSAFLLAHLGWRGTCLTYAGIELGICLPLILGLVPRAAPRPVAAGPARSDAVVLAPAERPVFLVLAAVVTCTGIATSVFSVHLLTLLQDRGLSLAAAVSLGTLIGPSQVGARFLEIANRSRHHPIWTLTVAVALMAVGLVLLWGGVDAPAVVLMIYGAGNGLYSIGRGTLPLALFGPERYGAILGLLAKPSLAAQALAPSAAAFLIAHGGADATLAALAVLGLIDLALVGALWRVRRRGAARAQPRRDDKPVPQAGRG